MSRKNYSNDINIEELLDEESSSKAQESADGKFYSPEEDSDSDSDSESELDTDSEYDGRRGIVRKRLKDDRLGSNAEVTKSEDLFQVLQSVLSKEEEKTNRVKFCEEKIWNFPEDPENWREEDLQELWADAPKNMTKPGWDPVLADEDDWEVLRDEVEDGRTPLIAPFYVPYRKPYPPIPDKSYHFDIRSPKSVVEELDRIEEFLRWVSYIFNDGSSYEGTVWDDLAHGKGVFVAQNGLVRYEGEWLQNAMEGHGVVEVDIPEIEPVPGSMLEKKMRANGMMISRDFMTPEDKEWLEMDIEDSYHLAGRHRQIPFYESNEWIKQFGKKPEKGRYRYAGQWKQGRMHGCGVYEVNEKTVYGRFYFGELLDEDEGCDDNTSALHAGIAEVAAAKARMFINKPDGMVREERGPYGDPQHPYFYEEEDVWMAPGFINQFSEVPDYWKTYVHEVDQEREMWLNSFYKAPLRIPMPAELEHWWSKDHSDEFVLINKEPEPDPDDPSKLVYTEDPLILHVPSGRLIDYMEDEKYGLRLFWLPEEIEEEIRSGEEIDSEKPEFLPLGYDEFFGRCPVVKEPHLLLRFVIQVQSACMDFLDGIKKWTEEQEKAAEKRKEKYEEELELEEAQLQLDEAMEDLDAELQEMEKEEDDDDEEGIETSLLSGYTSKLNGQDKETTFEKDVKEVEDKEEQEKKEENEEQDADGDEDGDEDEDEDDTASSSFGSAGDQKGKTPGPSPFSSSSLSFASSSVVSLVPYKLQESFSFWKGKSKFKMDPPPITARPHVKTVNSVHFPLVHCGRGILKVSGQIYRKVKTRKCTRLRSISKSSSCSSVASNVDLRNSKLRFDGWLQAPPERDMDRILSFQMPLYDFDQFRGYTFDCTGIWTLWNR